MGDNKGEGIFMRASLVNKVDINALDIGHKLRPAVEFFLKASPVIICRPVLCQLLRVVQWYALTPVFAGLFLGPAHMFKALFKVL